jgi:hypothetical protein
MHPNAASHHQQGYRYVPVRAETRYAYPLSERVQSLNSLESAGTHPCGLYPPLEDSSHLIFPPRKTSCSTDTREGARHIS